MLWLTKNTLKTNLMKSPRKKTTLLKVFAANRWSLKKKLEIYWVSARRPVFEVMHTQLNVTTINSAKDQSAIVVIFVAFTTVLRLYHLLFIFSCWLPKPRASSHWFRGIRAFQKLRTTNTSESLWVVLFSFANSKIIVAFLIYTVDLDNSQCLSKIFLRKRLFSWPEFT